MEGGRREDEEDDEEEEGIGEMVIRDACMRAPRGSVPDIREVTAASGAVEAAGYAGAVCLARGAGDGGTGSSVKERPRDGTRDDPVGRWKGI